MNWNAHFSSISGEAKTDFGAESALKPKWWDVRHWGIGEWGSVASIIGVGMWLFDQRKNCVPIADLRALKAARSDRQ